MRSWKGNLASWVSIVLAATLFPLIAPAVPGFGQNKEEVDGKFILDNSKVELTTFYFEISPYTYLSYVGDDVQGWTYLSGGFILSDCFSFSAFLILAPTVTEVNYGVEDLYATFRHLGLKIGYMHRADRMVFWRANLAVGLGGGYTLSSNTSVIGGLFDSWAYNTTMYSIEPSIGLGFNLLRWWRLYVDLGYRYMGPTDDVVDVSDDSFTVNIAIGLGKFRHKKPAKQPNAG